MTRPTLLVALLALLIALSSRAEDPKPESFPIPNHGDLRLTLPDGWTKTVQKPRAPSLPATILLTPKPAAAGKRAECELLLTPIPARDAKFNSPDTLKRLAEMRGKQMAPSSKEGALDLQELKGPSAAGYYFTFTDKDPGPGEFECMTACFVGVGDLFLSATILHHQKDAPDRTAALDLLKSASQSKPAAADKAADKPNAPGLHVSAPGAKWELILRGDLKVVDDQNLDERKARQITAVNQETGLVASIFLEPAAAKGDSTAVRTAYWSRAKNSPIPKRDIKLAKSGDYATVEYLVPDLKQKNLNIYIAHEGTWIDVHLSKVDFTPTDQPLFDNLVKSLRFETPGTK